MTLGVLAVDDNEMMCQAIERWVRRSPELRWDGAFTSGNGVLEAVEERRPDVVLMDMQIPGTDTCGLVRELTSKHPETRVLMLSGHLTKEYVLGSLDSGAVGYVGKHRDPEFIRDAIRRVGAGEFFVCDDAAAAAGLA